MHIACMSHNKRTVILKPHEGHTYLNVTSTTPDGAERYNVSCRIDEDDNLHRWLLAESWTVGTYTCKLVAQRPSAALTETLGTPPHRPLCLAEVIGRLCSLGGPKVTSVKSAGTDCRVSALNIITDVPRDSLGLPMVKPQEQPSWDDPAVRAEVEAKRTAAEKAESDLYFRKLGEKDDEKKEREAARALKATANKTSKELMRKLRELAGEKAALFKNTARMNKERWATGESYASFELPRRSNKELEELELTSEEEDARCAAPRIAAEARDAPAEAEYHRLLDSWKPAPTHWYDLSQADLRMFNNALDLFLAGVREHAAGFSDEQLAELFWSEDERRHIIIDEAFYEDRKGRHHA